MVDLNPAQGNGTAMPDMGEILLAATHLHGLAQAADALTGHIKPEGLALAGVINAMVRQTAELAGMIESIN